MSTYTCSYAAPSDAYVLNRNTGVKLKLSHNSARFENNYGTQFGSDPNPQGCHTISIKLKLKKKRKKQTKNP